jgi:hypothetical protein
MSDEFLWGCINPYEWWQVLEGGLCKYKWAMNAAKILMNDDKFMGAE